MEKNWTLYILECGDGTLYTGITDNLEKRLAAHRAGKGAKYTRGRSPIFLRYTAMQVRAERLGKIPKSKKTA